MAEGKIKWFNIRKGYGFIQRQGQSDIFLHISQWRGETEPKDGQQVRFEEGVGKKGPEAQDVVPVDSAAATQAPPVTRPLVRTPAERPPQSRDEYRFLNPYNFVRYLDQPRPYDHVLGDCPPPPHDRYVGLTGRITCSVEAVTPLFISDSHAIQVEKVKDEKGNEKDHPSYRFFQYDGKSAIPATSLRGMLRSTFEVVTNSCLAVFDSDRQLEYRADPRYGNRVKKNPGIVRGLAQPAKDGQPAVAGKIELCHVGQIGAYYKKTQRNVLGSKSNGEPWQCGDWVVARARRRKHDWYVTEIAEQQSSLGSLQIDGKGNREKYIEGWLKVTGCGEDTNKRSETLFLDPAAHDSTGTVSFGYEVQQEYNFVLAKQIQQGDLPAKPQSNTLRVGDLVWVDVKKQHGRNNVRRIVRVQVPRIPYRSSLGNLLPQHLGHCKNLNTLCPACRTFGWVHPNPPEELMRTAYAGRVRLSHATVQKEIKYDREITLTILSTPNPTTTQFYLLGPKGKPSPTVDYNTDGARLRGRKFYRHQGQANPSEYERDVKDDQNRTVRDALQPGSAFTFELEFENLTPLELGALLYALELEKGMVHRLGYAKPLGFGSVKIQLSKFQLLNWRERLASLDRAAGWSKADQLWREWVDDWVDKFKEKMQKRYGNAFEQVLLADLRCLLKPSSDLAIHYPRPTEQFDPDRPQFEWFVGNKKRKPSETLALANQDTSGLPLIRKDGTKPGQ